MFEMSIIESSGALKSNSSRFVWITATFNAMVVGAMILVPLLYPEALPRTSLTVMVVAPPPPPRAASVQQAPQQRAVKLVAVMNVFTAPTSIPHTVDRGHDDPPPVVGSNIGMPIVGAMDSSNGIAAALGTGTPPPVVTVTKPKVTAPALISSGVIAGNRISGNEPVYPAIPKAARVSGAVVLRAIISKSGEIRQLTVVSGHEMLRNSAVAAVQTWRYRPYLLNGEPTEVETTITVNFSLGG